MDSFASGIEVFQMGVHHHICDDGRPDGHDDVLPRVESDD